MSKIEEALKKAKGRQNDASGLAIVKNTETSSSSTSAELVPSQDADTAVFQRKSSAKEIALMEEGKLLENKKLAELKIIFSDMSDNKIANTYRDLRTKLVQKSKGRNFITMITSCTTGDDSSSTALNLATAFSFDESKTSLLIDCNLNAPKLGSLLNLKTEFGLIDYLESENIDINTVLHKTGIKRLRMIPAGAQRETSTEYFTSLRLRELMSDLLNRYSDRYIFIDSAPIIDSADTRILVELCDYVLLVVPYGKATRSRIKDAASSIGNEKLLGVVFSDKPNSPGFKIPGTGRSRA